MNGSRAVAIFGLGLVAANTATAGYGADIKAAITGEKQSRDAHVAFLAVIGQVLFVLVLAFLADLSPDLGTIIVALLLGLWLVWAVAHADKIKSAADMLGIKGA
jgi:hypothetical protein